MSSGSRGTRVTEKSSTAKTVSDNITQSNSITEKKMMKVATADQIRLAQITENSQDYALQENIEQFMAITGKNREDASIILHDHGNDLEAAVNANYEGDTNLDAWHETTKKKKTKAKIEIENKENRKNGSDGNRERSASRGRGGGAAGMRGQGRGRREGGGEGAVRGGGSRRGRMANGGGPIGGRGRGGRSIRGGRGGASGRGSSPHFSDNTFHSSRQNTNYDETIEVWGEEPNKILSDPCPIEEWGDEWTGSLDKTSVFVHSAVEPTPPPASDLTAIDAAKLVNSSPLVQSGYPDDGQGATAGVNNPPPQSYSAAATQSVVPPANLGGLVPNQTQAQATLGGLAALLHQAAPQSMLSSSSSATANGKVSHMQQQQSNILGGISTNVGDVLKGSSNSSNVAQYSANTSATAASNNYSSAQHNSIFSTSLQNNVTRNLSNTNSGINTSLTSVPLPSKPPGVIVPSLHQPVSLPPASGHVQPPRAKANKVKQNQTSKIPLSAVEMPDDVMSAINLQMTGLQFGSEGFDFLSDGNKPSTNLPDNTPSYSSTNTYTNPPPPSVSSSTYQPSYVANNSLAQGSLSQEKSMPKPPSMSQTNKLGPEPIPFPNQISSGSSSSNNQNSKNSSSNQSDVKSSAVDNNSSSTGSSSTNWRNAPPPHVSHPPPQHVTHPPPSSNVSASNTPQKKDIASNNSSSTGVPAPPPGGLSTNSLGSLVGSGSNYSSYSLPKTSTTFPSPPTGPYSQSNVQNAYTNRSANDSNNDSAYVSAGQNQSANSNSNSSANVNSNNSQQQQSNYGSSSNYGVSTSSQQYSNTNQSNSVQYQNNYNSSSHSSLPKQLTTPHKETNSYSATDSNSTANANSTNNNSSGGVSNSTSVATAVSSSLSSLQSAAVQQQQQQQQQQHHQQSAAVQQQKAPVSAVTTGPPPGVQHHSQQHMAAHTQQQVPAVAQQQMLVQQQQQQQYVGSNPAALQGGMPPYFHGMQQQPMYTYEELQLLQSRIPHLQQAPVPPSTMAGSRDSSLGAPGGYSASADVNKFRTDQNSSPVPTAINTQGGHAGYIANAGNAAAAMHPMYMYHQNVVQSSAFPQYATQAIIQLPPNTAGSNTNQFQPTTKLQYNAAGAPTYYDAQGGGDYKGTYGSAPQNQNKASVPNNSASMANSVSEMPAYKNHLAKSYDKPAAFHTSTPPPFNLPGSAGAPYAQVYLPTMPHQSTLMHHQLHQDGSNSGAQRGSTNSVQNKTASKPTYQPQAFWGN